MTANGIILNINKPAGLTSFGVVRRIRRITGVKKVGHAGTLDPFATGVLILLVGRKATRRFDEFASLDKSYSAIFRFGLTTDSHDITGETLSDKPADIKESDIQSVLADYQGEVDQVPPMFSAKKVNGKRLYKLARQGKRVEREVSKVTIHQIDAQPVSRRDFRFDITCSKGTYIRALARDIGSKLGVGACVTELTRTAIGEYNLDTALLLEEVEEKWNSIAA